jgi:ferritin
MLKPEIEKALNHQLNEEQTASQEYLAMAAWFDDRNLRGFASFMRRQSDEERAHSMKFFDHLADRGARIRIESLRAPKGEFTSPLDVFKAALERERQNTRAINECYRLAHDHSDYATQTFLHWFINEQVEEEQWAEEAVALLETAGDNESALLMLDNRYGAKEEKGDDD